MKKFLIGTVAIQLIFSVAFFGISCQKEEVRTVAPESVYRIQGNAIVGITDKNYTAYTLPSEIDGVLITSVGDYVFKDCSLVQEITISESISEIGFGAFSGCQSLETISVPNGVLKIGLGAFSDCVGLKKISISGSVLEIGKEAFYGCNGLEEMEVASTNRIYRSEGNCIIEKETQTLLFGCKNTVIPSSVVGIGTAAFFGCGALESIDIPSSVSVIGNNAFLRCSNLKEITFSRNVQSIGSSAFAECGNLKRVNYEGTHKQWSEILIQEDNEELERAIIYYGV